MTMAECPYEASVAAAIASGGWPACADAGLREHVDACASCAEVALVAPLLRDDYLAGRADVQVPGAGQVWWRSAVRARLEVAEHAVQPITWMQGIAGAGAAGLLAALMALVWPSLLQSAASALAVLPGRAIEPQTIAVVMALVRDTLPLLIVVGLCLLVAPVAVYLATSDK